MKIAFQDVINRKPPINGRFSAESEVKMPDNLHKCGLKSEISSENRHFWADNSQKCNFFLHNSEIIRTFVVILTVSYRKIKNRI